MQTRRSDDITALQQVLHRGDHPDRLGQLVLLLLAHCRIPRKDLEDALINIQEEHDALAENTEILEIGLEKTDIRVAEAKLVWVPVA